MSNARLSFSCSYFIFFDDVFYDCFSLFYLLSGVAQEWDKFQRSLDRALAGKRVVCPVGFYLVLFLKSERLDFVSRLYRSRLFRNFINVAVWFASLATYPASLRWSSVLRLLSWWVCSISPLCLSISFCTVAVIVFK